MVLESTILCIDSSEYMRNGDFIPSRLQAQHEAVQLICLSKTRSNPENNVGLITMSTSPQVLTTLTADVNRILAKLHEVQPSGDLNLVTGIRVAHLALKHRLGKNHKMKIVAFVGSPVNVDEKELIKLAKRLKKEKVNVDIINFGEEGKNTEKLTAFINTLNGRDGTGSHLVTVPPGPHLSDALISSPIIQGEDGTGAVGLGGSGFEFGIDPNEDPELALALRVSMEEQRQRQEEEARRVAAISAQSGESSSEKPKDPSAEGASTSTGATNSGANTEEALLEKALQMSLESDAHSFKEQPAASSNQAVPDFASMSEEEQIAYAMQMSLQQAAKANKSDNKEIKDSKSSEEPMETDQGEQEKKDEKKTEKK